MRNALGVGLGLAMGIGWALGACSSDSGSASPPDSGAAESGAGQGSEGQACYGNHTCNEGLTCASNLCVNLGGGADAAPSADGSSDAGADSAEASVVPPSCVGLAATCGPAGTGDCCASTVVPAGTYTRVSMPEGLPNGTGGTATVSDFRLDTYEITVGRFRKFVAAYTQTMTAAGAGKNPHNASDPGWDVTWNASLPATASALSAAVLCDAKYGTWTSAAGANETRPVNCITWFEAQAFCTWDGGRLPTEAEWQYAAAGGTEARTYPWGAAAPAANANLAVYSCYYPTPGPCIGQPNLAPVGTVSAGNARWGQADMAGNVAEWNQDWYDATGYPATCSDCADLVPTAANRILRGGSFDVGSGSLPAATRHANPPATRFFDYGARCARTP